MRLTVRVLCAVMGLVCVLGILAAPPAKAQVVGQNVNMVSGTKWPNGDPFLQRQNEPSIAVSTRNPLHILAGANDYRSVDLEQVLTGGAETGDAWLGLFKSFDGGYTWQSTLLPGCPYAIGQCKDSGALSLGNYQAAADPVVRAGTNGMFFYAGLAFDRATATSASSISTIFVARYNDLNNNEQADPITYIDTHIVASGNSTQFLDKPSMAVDIPRSGAGTCSFTANEPGVGANGGPLAVRQSFAAGNIYLAYTDFIGNTGGAKGTATPTHLMFTHSTDCGVTWGKPVQINTGTTTSQGSTIAVNPVTGAVYVAWRQFASSGVSDAIMIAQSTNAGKSFSTPVQISSFTPFDQGTSGTTFRTNAYPALTSDMFGFVYVAFSARGVSASGDARIVAAGSLDGTHWTPAIMVDNPPLNAQTNPSGRGHQIMPAMTFANGRLALLYYDLRLDHYGNVYTPNPVSPGSYSAMLQPEGELGPGATPAEKNQVFTTYIDDNGLTLRRHTLDLRVLELGIFPTVVLGPSVLVSQYEFGCCVNPESPDIEQFKFNVPNLPLFDSGTEAFLGDYIDIVPSPAFVPNGSGWAYNFMPSVNPLFHATWTDNRDVVPPPPGGSWENYTAPVVAGAISVENGNPLPSCVNGQEGMRNQNIYTSQITGGLVAAAPGNAKPLGTTTFNGQTVPFQRAFPVLAQNTTNAPLNVRFSIANQPTGGTASFLQFSTLTTLDVTIPPYSSVSRSVFATSTNAAASITVNVTQISAIGGSAVTNGLTSTAVLNPDITNPNITNPNITNPNITNPNITNAEVTNPNITNPNITNPNITNPNITNPNITNTSYLNPNITNPNITNLDVTNVSATNPNITNPNITNPNITNPNITNPNITNPNITNPDITNGSIQDVTYPITNNGNTTASYTVKTATNSTVPGGIVLQLLINKLYQTPVAVNCQLGVQTHWVTVANITNPMLFTSSNPNITNPDITNAVPNEGSVTLAPGETAFITIRVVNPTPALTPFNPLTAITPVTVPQAVNTTTVLANPGNPNLTAPPVYPPITVLTAALPVTDRFDAGYAVQLQAGGGKPGTDTWSIAGGGLPPGIGLSASGLVSGTANTPGSFPVTIQVADSAVPPNVGTQNYTLNVSVTPLTLQFVLTPPDGVVGQPYSTAPLAVNGGTTPYIWTAPGLPAGLAINPSTGQISGIPTVANPAGSIVTITATDAATPAESVPYSPTIRIGAPIQITPLTLPAGTIGVPYTFQVGASGGIGGLGFGPPAPAAGVTLSSSGLLSIANPQTSSITFTINVHDGSQPVFQTVNANYTINFAGPAIGNVTFKNQPPNYVGGLPNPNSPVVVHVADNTNSPIPGANVTMSFNGTPPCSTAVLSGTLTQQTNATGDAFFTDLNVDRGQTGYTLKATVSSVFGVSNPFTVNGFCGTGGLSAARDFLTATLLPNGQVLVAGGQDASSAATNAADLYDPTTGVSTGISGLNLGRYGHTATLLNDGTVLMVGGFINATYLGSAEIYNPGTQTFTTLGNSLNTPRAYQTATLLADGTVLIAGGFNGSPLSSAEIYNPTAQTFTTVGPLHSARYTHAAALLPNGKVLIASGLDATAELYDPVAKTFSLTGNLNTARQSPTATLLPTGKVLVAGGLVGSVGGIATAELYDPAAGAFTFTGSLNNARGSQTATLLPDGTVLVAGGYNCPGTCTNPIQGTAEIYNPSFATFALTGSLINARWQDTATLLNDGTVLVSGGFSGNGPTASNERYYSTAPLSALQLTTPTVLASGQPDTTAFTNPTAFNGAATGITPIGFNGILPVGVQFEGFNPLIVSGYNFSTTNPSTTVNVTTSAFYSPNIYGADFIIDSSNPGPNNEVIIILPAPTRALGIDYGGFGGGSTGSISLSNGFVLPLSGLPAAGQTQFSGFVSATPFNALTLSINNDSWVVLDLLAATANTALTSATEGAPYTQMLLEQGGVGPLTWTLANGSLPPGMNLSASGVISGTPTASGAYTFTVHLVDSSPAPKAVTSGSLTLTVRPLPPTNLIVGPGGPSAAILTWTASNSPDVAGYKVYRGISSGNYTTVISAGNVIGYTDTPGTGSWFYVVTAVSNLGTESVVSNEVHINVP
jgi:uncharacterized protein YjbI with pentapeptide repeats